MRQTVNIISLGCSKNLVDTELLMKQLEKAGYAVEIDVEESTAGVVVVNTCGFIGDAKEESVNTILEQVERKRTGSVERVFVMGCLSQRYAGELKREIPEVDAWFGKFDWKGILTALGEQYHEAFRDERCLTTPSHYAYLKISEGCDRTCSYCAIPLMTGHHVSRPFEEIIREAEQLAAGGVKELLVVAQDTTYYGVDRYGKNRLAELVDRLAAIPGIEWIRLHYAYPAGFPLDLLAVMRERPNVCNYLDIALQHCSDRMLRLMRRGVTGPQTRALVRKIRQEVPGIVLRTTLMTGHPGESVADFREMLDFVSEMKFERLGIFPYSHEEDTYCYKHYRDDVPGRIKHERAEEIMERQRQVSADFNAGRIGQRVRVLIDRVEGDGYVGRTEYDSPEVDPEVFIRRPAGELLQVGTFREFTITSADDYDIYVT
ncbi:MAG: 30S ribosomal protein S12 methylthiotransferase RimO [Odoribacteraceae bacterium]|jgi:ribosomal protein S12 methylthiotransferase|nr:30S ribosomal protein S12 methylthiotransferase RimO [Odoribacteraceae bacterium]